MLSPSERAETRRAASAVGACSRRVVYNGRVSVAAGVRAIDLSIVEESLHLSEQLAGVPLGSEVRGVWFSITSQHMARLGRVNDLAWRAAVDVPRRKVFRLYPVTEYLRELAAAGAIVDPSDPREGVRRIWRAGAELFGASLIGRSIARLVNPNPLTALRFVERTRDHSCNYGTWEIERVEPGYAVLRIENEYIWIDSAHRGGAEGMLIMCGVEGSVEPELVSKYHGRLHIRWRLH